MAGPDLNDLAARPARYWHIDGLPELMVGCLWVVWGAAWLAGEAVPRDWRWTAYWLLMPPLLAAAAVALNRATRRLKDRVTVPRAGYVAWNPPGYASRVAIAASIVVAALVLAALVLAGGAPFERRAPAVLSVSLSLSFIAVAISTRMPHHFVLAAAALMLTLAIVPLTSGWDAFNWVLIALGAACAIVGAVRLVLFLRAHPRAAEGM